MIQDLRHAARSLARSPGFCIAVVVTLAVGIGANTAMFSFFHALLVQPLPYPHGDRIVQVWSTNAGRGLTRAPVSPLDFQDWRRENRSFERLAAARFWYYTLTGEGTPEQLHGMRVSPGFFEALGVAPARGRTFLPEEERRGQDRVVVLTHSVWQRRFDADPSLVGRAVSIDGEPYTVVGILPPDFWFYPVLGRPIELWMPLPMERAQTRRDARSMLVYGLLERGVSIHQAQAEMTSLAADLEREHPAANGGWGVRIEPGINSKAELRPKILLLFGAVGFVLLMACANAANLTLARALRRRSEIAVRSALGASRIALARRLLVESLLSGAIACAAGLMLATACLRWLMTSWGPRFEAFLYGGLDSVRLNAPVLAFGIIAALVSTVLLGVLPALQASRPNVVEALKSGDHGSGGGVGRRPRAALMMAQMALALTLTVGAGLMIRTLTALESLDRGLNPAGVLTAQVWRTERTWAQPRELVDFQQQVVDRIEALPGVVSAGASNFLPLSEMSVGSNFTIEGRPQPPSEGRPHALYFVVTSGFLETMQISLRSGRYPRAADAADAPAVAVIDEKLAQRYWPGEDPIGRRVRLDSPDEEDPWQAHLAPHWITVVGVVSTVLGDGFWNDGAPAMYLPFAQNPSAIMHLAVRTEGDPLRLAPAVRTRVWDVDPDQPLSRVRPMDDVPEWALSERRLTLQLLAAFSAVAILMAFTGLYAVISYAASQRTREIGIRLALGARRRQVAGLVIRQGLILALAGLGLGSAAVFALTRVLSRQLYGVTAIDATTVAAACLLLLGVAVCACYLPARRAGRLDPIAVLRHE